MVQRKDRVASELLKIVSLLVRKEINDPGMGFVTFLSTRVTKDLRSGFIYYSVLGDEDKKQETEAILKKYTKHIKKLVNNELGLRYAMDIRFVRESILDESFRVDEILNRIAKEKKEKGKARD